MLDSCVSSCSCLRFSATSQYFTVLPPPNGPVRIVGAYMAVASDAWLASKKLPVGDAMPFPQRLALCACAASSSSSTREAGGAASDEDGPIPLPYAVGDASGEIARIQGLLQVSCACLFPSLRRSTMLRPHHDCPYDVRCRLPVVVPCCAFFCLEQILC
jgi:hypothetical protein